METLTLSRPATPALAFTTPKAKPETPPPPDLTQRADLDPDDARWRQRQALRKAARSEAELDRSAALAGGRHGW